MDVRAALPPLVAVLAGCGRDVSGEMRGAPPGSAALPGAGAYVQSREVTNAQYLAFVRDTQRRPPLDWYRKALELARATHGPIADPEAWVRAHPDARWRIPPGEEALPVRGVALEEAEAYARWAGQRLPTVEEIRAAGEPALASDVAGMCAAPWEWSSTSAADRAVWAGECVDGAPVPRAWDPTAAPLDVGFRCAASAVACRDHAEVLAREVAGLLELAPERAAGLEHWRTEIGGNAAAWALARYEHLLLAPVRSLGAGAQGPQPLAILSTTIAIRDPELAPGIYRMYVEDGRLMLQDRDGVRTALDARAALTELVPSASCARAARLKRGSLVARDDEVLLATWIPSTADPGRARRLEARLAIAHGTLEADWRATQPESSSRSAD